ncbi:MAG: hypothetical protein DHS20C06_08020 [Hyphobacterium sp.]|nr:MAG: hypothetical protein DHS20C06_08020 [Hyphobacterium sp.]
MAETGRVLSVSIRDDGPGVDPESTYKGVGSSLFEAFAIQLEGEARTESEPGKGTTVSLRFPI